MSPSGNLHELREIISKRLLTSVFQPIVNLQQPQIFGFEALIRGPSDGFFHSPLSLFDAAARYHLLVPLEEACLEVSSRQYVQYSESGNLFLNLSPMSLLESDNLEHLLDWLSGSLGLPAEQIVIELSEHYPLDDYDSIRSAIDSFRCRGFRIAIDDLGAGYAGLRAWSELRPDFVKIDRHFIENINRDPIKREFVRSIREIAREMGCLVIAEGIESADELCVVREMDIHLGQGYFIGRPVACPEKSQLILDRIRPLSQQTTIPRSRLGHRVAEITLTSPSVESVTTLNEVVEVFQQNRWMTCLPIVDMNIPIGMVDRQGVLELFSRRYSRELYGRKPIYLFMNSSPVIVADTTPLEEVSRLLTSGVEERMALDFIVTSNQEFYGIAKTSTLLQRITDQQIRNARYSNPLTLLPGNVPLYERLDEHLSQNANFCVAYFDLDHFKPFNDLYGYSRGDDVIVSLSKILAASRRSEDDFIAHIGGDDFVAIYQCGNCEQRCEDIIAQFAQGIVQFYCEDSLSKGGIWGANRVGQQQFFPIMSLSVGIVCPDPDHCRSYHDVAALAVEAKREAKQMAGNSLFFSRRRRPQKPVNA